MMLLAYTIDEWGDADIGDGVYRCYEDARYGCHREDTQFCQYCRMSDVAVHE